MDNQRRPVLWDVDPDGAVHRAPPPLREARTRPTLGLPLGTRIAIGAGVAAVIAGALGIAALAIWAALLLIPLAIAAGAVAAVALRVQTWRQARSASFGGLPRRR